MRETQKQTIENLLNLRGKINSVLAQGLHIVSPDELGAYVQGLSALHLEQPAVLLKQIRQNIADGTQGQKDVESLVKVLQTLSQAEIRLSEAALIEKEHLVEGCNSVYVPSHEMAQGELKDLIDIISLPNPFVRGFRVREYFKTATYEKLVQSIEIAWFDYALVNFICAGLQERPDEALKLAQMALNHRNQVIQRTALKVLERVGMEISRAQEVLDILAKRFEKPKTPLKHLIEEIRTKVERRYNTSSTSRQQEYAMTKKYKKFLTSSKKSERYAGMSGVVNLKDPCFTDMLARALDVEEDKKHIKFLLRGMVEIGGFDAISTMSRFFEGPYARQALEAVSKLGDRSVLTFLFNRIATKLPASYYRDFLPVYGDLAIEPLLYTLKTMENPVLYKSVFANIFTMLRSNALIQSIIAVIENDAEFADKFASLMLKIYPKLFEKAGTQKKAGTPSLNGIKQAMLLTLGGTKIERKYITGMFLTPDGTHLVVLTHGQGHQNQVSLFSTSTWKQESSPKITGDPSLIALSVDGSYLFTARYDSSIRSNCVEIWEFGRWKTPVGRFPHSKRINNVNATSDHRYIVVGGEKTVRVIKFGSWQEVMELKGYDWRVSFMQPIPGKHMLMIGDWQGWLHVWDELTWNQIARIKSDSWAPKFAELSSDGKLLVYAGYIGIKVWETETWQETLSVSKPKGFDYMTLTPDSKYLIVSKTKTLRFLKFGTWKEVLKLDNDEKIGNIIVTPDEKQVITSGNSGIRIWDIDLPQFIEH